MKLLSTVLFAATLLLFLSGCASETDSSGYSPGQIRAQHSEFDTRGVH